MERLLHSSKILTTGLVAATVLSASVRCSSDSNVGKRSDVKTGVVVPDDPLPPAAPAATGAAAPSAAAPVDTSILNGVAVPRSAKNTVQLNEAAVMAEFVTECSKCHGVAANGDKGANYNSWPMTSDVLSLQAFETSIYAPIVYVALYNKLSTTPATVPTPMPPGPLTDARRDNMLGVLGWFNVNLPFVVAEAEQTYGMKTDATAGNTTLQFACTQPVTARVFLNRMTEALFDRPPTDQEFSKYTPEQLAAPVTKALRAQIVAKMNDIDWKAEFQVTGLRKLADAIGGGPAIDDSAAARLPAGAAADLRDEFFQMLKANYDTFSYADYFKTSKVMVSMNTAPLYGCTGSNIPTEAGVYVECNMQAPRKGFFTTLGYLNSKPSSFLKENNNYGRVASMYLTIMGQGFQAATNGPAGDGAVNPLPACLEAADTRTRSGAARGTVAIPSFGNTCQACHISRNLANGSVLFRPFAINGQVYDPATFGTGSMPDKPEFDLATMSDWERLPSLGAAPSTAVQVDTDYLKNLLVAASSTSAVKACAVTGNVAKPTVPLLTVDDLAQFLMANESALVRGFIRNAHRAYGISQQVNFDLIYTAIESYKAGKNKVPDLLEGYFGSETFACSAGG